MHSVTDRRTDRQTDVTLTPIADPTVYDRLKTGFGFIQFPVDNYFYIKPKVGEGRGTAEWLALTDYQSSSCSFFYKKNIVDHRSVWGQSLFNLLPVTTETVITRKHSANAIAQICWRNRNRICITLTRESRVAVMMTVSVSPVVSYCECINTKQCQCIAIYCFTVFSASACPCYVKLNKIT